MYTVITSEVDTPEGGVCASTGPPGQAEEIRERAK